MRRIAGIAAMTAMALALAAGAANADTKTKKIAFSNNYAGNSWRQAMLKSYDAVTKKAVADGVVAAADVFTTSENQVTEQAAQIQNLILQGYDAIVINAASPAPPSTSRSMTASRPAWRNTRSSRSWARSTATGPRMWPSRR